jgi:hypothetical protein
VINRETDGHRCLAALEDCQPLRVVTDRHSKMHVFGRASFISVFLWSVLGRVVSCGAVASIRGK